MVVERAIFLMLLDGLRRTKCKNPKGNKMEDIIFSGTDKRKALGYAEVNIIFDNKDGIIPIDYQEVAITRRMFRSGNLSII